MNIIKTALPEVLIIEPKVWGDDRGYFLETYRANRYSEYGIQTPLVQDNQSFSRNGVLRGLHAQHPNAQGKLIQVLDGEVFDVAVDIRRSSPNFGRWVGVILSGENKRQFWIPAGFAHGFLVTGDHALFFYKNTTYYSPEHEFSIRWNDPDIGIEWPVVGMPELSTKDRNALCLKEIDLTRLPD
ncbi:dTDP-4-dehydrorhamnose 3,5-epimerase [Chromatium weissei]|nr:dTDP-4-dehydrorhamnose 3,5-epimerase [Chromatium weissei]